MCSKKPFPILKRLEVALGETCSIPQKALVYHLLAEYVHSAKMDNISSFYKSLDYKTLSPIHNPAVKFDSKKVNDGRNIESLLNSTIILPEPGNSKYISKMKELREIEFNTLKNYKSD